MGFEPTMYLYITAFKTDALNRSATIPNQVKEIESTLLDINNFNVKNKSKQKNLRKPLDRTKKENYWAS